MNVLNPHDFATARAKLDTLRAKHVRTPTGAALRERLDRLLKCDAAGQLLPETVALNSTNEINGIAIGAPTGSGKTTLVRHILEKHPALQPKDERLMPVVSVRVPSPATLKSLGLTILGATGYPAISERRERWSICQIVPKRFQVLGTVILWIDEAHDLFESASSRELSDMLKTLKSLMQDEGKVILILTGTETLWQALSHNPELTRRFSRINLPAISHAAQGRQIEKLVRSYCAAVELAAPTQDDLVSRLIHASRGRFGLCIESLLTGIEIALLEGARALDIDHFAQAFAMKEGCGIEQNIYLARHWSRIDPDAPPTY